MTGLPVKFSDARKEIQEPSFAKERTLCGEPMKAKNCRVAISHMRFEYNLRWSLPVTQKSK